MKLVWILFIKKCERNWDLQAKWFWDLSVCIKVGFT